jgi:outer membrane protein assembly factor BamE (lipoprotein component of BamABCDE complex)
VLRKLLVSLLLAGLTAITMSGCDADKLSKLRPGTTKSSEVRKLMGEPNLEWLEEDGTRTWEYPRTPEGIVNHMLVIGPDNVLREVRQVLTAENFARIKPGMNREQVRRLLGRPAHERYFSLRQERVWDWKTKVEAGMEWYFNVHFDEAGIVTRTSASSVPKG